MANRPTRELNERRARLLERALVEGRKALRSQATRHTPQSVDADDALQEACLQFLRYYDGPPGETALRWLMLCVKHRGWEIGRRQRARDSFEVITTTDAHDPERPLLRLPCERPDPAEWAQRSERVCAFFAALTRLKPDQRTALLLLGLGYSYAEIGARQSWSPTKVNRCLVEGRAALRAIDVGGEFSPLTLLDE
jgi:RNA polymerase sigma factor (sigma-70 family)